MKVLIVEDEPIIARRTLRIITALLGPQLEKSQICHTIPSALAYLEKESIDLLFLDLNLYGEDGFTLLESMVAAPFHTIIISAYREKAIRAFEYGVLDFIPKPFNQARIEQALARIDQIKLPESQHLRFLTVQKRGRHQLVEIQDLLYIKGAGIYSELFLKDGTKEIHNKTLEKLNQLLPEQFDRIHKSYILNRTVLQEIIVEPGSKYSVLLKDGTQLPIGRTRYKRLKKKWRV
jgi:DNA-binding LytR/AlgR family response regulator